MKRASCILILALYAHPCRAQDPGEYGAADTLMKARELYENGAHTRSIVMLETMLPFAEGQTLIETYLFLAFNYTMIGDRAKAIENFKNALAADPDLQIDDYAPTEEIADVYEDALREKAYESAGCSCFMPGIGQFMKGDDGKGQAIVAASVVTLAGTLISWSIADSRHNEYLSLGPDDVELMDQTYDEYNKWCAITYLSGAAFTAVYVYGILDAMLVRKPAHRRTGGTRTGMILQYNGSSVRVGYAKRL